MSILPPTGGSNRMEGWRAFIAPGLVAYTLDIQSGPFLRNGPSSFDEH